MPQPSERTILLVASERRELAAFARRLEKPRLLDWGLDYAAEGWCGGTRFLLAANGAGARLALRAAEEALAHARPSLIVSTGYCGALAPHLRIGDIVVCRQAGGEPGEILGVDHVVTTAGDKRKAFARTRAAAVDMESHALAQLAAGHGIPFRIIRAVSDEAGEDLGLDLNLARDGEGRIRAATVIRLALLHPFSGLPALKRLASNASCASDRLGDFLASTRFD
ncbi:MAG: hypothetical protein IT163_15650 [Bryobacterales bacterium]|nr:hypothetical protein [Bryobacterales bacterium]